MESDNVAKLRHVYRRWHDTRGGSVQDWLDVMADDATLRSLSGGADEMPYTAARSGKDGVAAYFAGLAVDWEMIHYTADEFIEQGDRVVVLGTCAFRFRKTGKVVESPKVDVFRFRDGKVVEAVEFFDTARAHAATRPD